MFLVVTLAQACALRPRYRDFVGPKSEAQVPLLVTDDNGLPIANAKIELSEWKNRLVLTSGANGVLNLPVEKKYLDENPVLVLQLPPGVSSYRLALAPPPLPPAPPVEAPAPPTPATPAPGTTP